MHLNKRLNPPLPPSAEPVRSAKLHRRRPSDVVFAVAPAEGPPAQRPGASVPAALARAAPSDDDNGSPSGSASHEADGCVVGAAGGHAVRTVHRAGAGGRPAERAVRFFSGEDHDVAAATGKMAISARVIGDELLTLCQSHQRGQRARGVVGSVQSDAVVEMLPSDQGMAAKVIVRHPDLGSVQLRVQAEPGFLSMEIVAQDDRVLALFSADVDKLRLALDAVGVPLRGLHLRSASAPRKANVPRYHSIQEEA